MGCVSYRFVSLTVSTKEAIMDSLNRDIVMVLDNELIMDLVGGVLNGVFSACLTTNALSW